MLDSLLEEPVELETAFDKAWLMAKFEQEVVGPKIKEKAVLEEIEYGHSIEIVLDEIWKGFEEWADEYLKDQEQSYFEGQHE